MIERLPLPLALVDAAFIQCLRESIECEEIVSNYIRLYCDGKRERYSPREFMEFVHDCIYLRLPDDAIVSLRMAT